MRDLIQSAWEYFINGEWQQAKLLAEPLFVPEECADFSLLNLMGYISIEEKNYEEAKEHFEQYIRLAEKNEDVENLHIGLHQLAMAYRECGEYRKALDLIEEEASILRENFAEDPLKKAVNLYEQGILNLRLQRLNRALSDMRQSLEYASKTDDLIAQACARRGLGEIYLAMSRSKEAVRSFEEAIHLFEAGGDDIGAGEVRSML